MSSRNRETLRNYFKAGEMPTEGHFVDLIDSMLNMHDEGFCKSVEHGDEIYAAMGHDALISFYRDQKPGDVLWRVQLGRTEDQLQIGSGESTPALLSLDAQQRVGIGQPKPRDLLDVGGTLACEARRGRWKDEERPDVLANGEWQDITPDLHGCQGFEVMAGTGRQGSGHFSLLHAVALNTYNPGGGLLAWFKQRRGIRQTRSWWGRRCDRLELRWCGSHGREAEYRLQIRSGCDFGPGQRIQVQLTQLWTDPTMADSQPRQEATP